MVRKKKIIQGVGWRNQSGSPKNDIYFVCFVVEYPCEFGFDYMTVGATIWIIYLPFYIVTLLGNCWRQCCCCLCDPLVSLIEQYNYSLTRAIDYVHYSINYIHPYILQVCFATICDFFKRCLCECGKFSCIDLVWYTMCTFQGKNKYRRISLVACKTTYIKTY